METIEVILKTVLVGSGATLLMDIWLSGLKRLGIPTLNFAFIGRWAGHLLRGKAMHVSIAGAAPIAHESALGWCVHYAVGIAFAFLLVGIAGSLWLARPTPAIALSVGLCTVAFPLLLMQPAMGLGIAATRTATPLRNCLRSLINHGVFGIGLFLSACVVEWISR